jgi:catalase (peroxidase I)
LRKFRVRANFQKVPSHEANLGRKHDGDGGSSRAEKDFEILADDPDDAKVKVRKLLEREGYDERSLDHITWTATRLDQPRKRK